MKSWSKEQSLRSKNIKIHFYLSRHEFLFNHFSQLHHFPFYHIQIIFLTKSRPSSTVATYQFLFVQNIFGSTTFFYFFFYLFAVIYVYVYAFVRLLSIILWHENPLIYEQWQRNKKEKKNNCLRLTLSICVFIFGDKFIINLLWHFCLLFHIYIFFVLFC